MKIGINIRNRIPYKDMVDVLVQYALVAQRLRELDTHVRKIEKES